MRPASTFLFIQLSNSRLGGNRLGQHDAVAHGHVAADDGGNGAQIHIRAAVQLFQSAPAQVGGVDVYVKNNPVHTRIIHHFTFWGNTVRI